MTDTFRPRPAGLPWRGRKNNPTVSGSNVGGRQDHIGFQESVPARYLAGV